MKKLTSILGLLALGTIIGVYLFYFYLPKFSEPEGLSIEVKSKKDVEKELGFLPVVSSTQTVFLPEPKDVSQLEEQQEQELRKIQSVLDQETEAARRIKVKKPSEPAVPQNFQNMAPKVIEVDLSRQILIRWENGQKLDENLISSGRRGMPTPTGVFQIKNKIPVAYSRKYRLFMPYWMAFTSGGHGIHELPIFRNGKREGANHLGRPVSHGCVRLGVGPAQLVYQWAEIGTPVVIHN